MWLVLFLAIITILFWKIDKNNLNEEFSGVLTQLYSKGPQDRYLIGNDAIKYYYWNPYYETVWNNPSRLTNFYYDPFHRRFPHKYGHLYPYYTFSNHYFY